MFVSRSVHRSGSDEFNLTLAFPVHPESPSLASQNLCQLDVLAQAEPGWKGLPLRLARLPGQGSVSDMVCVNPTMVIARSGFGRRWYTTNGRTRELASAPRMLDLYAAGYHIERGRWDGQAGELLTVELNLDTLGMYSHHDLRNLSLATQLEVFDDSLVDLADRLWSEARNGLPNGRLYSDGLTIAMLGLLTAHHGASRNQRQRPVGTFSANQRSRLQGFVENGLGTNLSVPSLAAVVGISPDHFSRVFKATFDRTPHAYLTEKRIEAACRALQDEPARPLADISVGCGFSSQAHFTEVFRRQIGTTPARWRIERQGPSGRRVASRS